MGDQNSSFTPQSLHAFLSGLTSSHRFCIAYSGGLDSHVLLHAMALLRKENPHYHVRAIHVHHGLQASADQWAIHCRRICEALWVDCLVERVALNLDQGESIEALAREARYGVFESALEPGECLLTAHTQDDQAETVLLQLFRGSGVKGLAAMPLQKELGKGFLLRPLLSVTRERLVRYAKQHALQWIEDDSNRDDRFDRNYVRRHVLPAIKRRWPEVLKTVSRSAAHCAVAANQLEQQAALDLANIQQGDLENAPVSVSALKALPYERLNQVLRHWIHRSGYRVPSAQQLVQIQQDLLNSQAGAEPLFSTKNWCMRRYRDQLFLLSHPPEFDREQQWLWRMGEALDLKNGVRLSVKVVLGEGLSTSIERVLVRFRREGDRCRPAGRQGTRTLKNLFQEWGVPPWERDKVALLCDPKAPEVILAVVGHCVCEGGLASVDELGRIIEQ